MENKLGISKKLFRSGGAGRKRGVGKMNSRPALAFFAAAIFRASESGAPPIYLSASFAAFSIQSPIL